MNAGTYFENFQNFWNFPDLNFLDLNFFGFFWKGLIIFGEGTENECRQTFWKVCSLLARLEKMWCVVTCCNVCSVLQCVAVFASEFATHVATENGYFWLRADFWESLPAPWKRFSTLLLSVCIVLSMTLVSVYMCVSVSVFRFWSVLVSMSRCRCRFLCLCHTIQHRFIVCLPCACGSFHKRGNNHKRALFSCRRALFSSALETIQHPFIARLQFALYSVCACVCVCLFVHLRPFRYLRVCLYYIIHSAPLYIIHFISSICILLSMTVVSAFVARICVAVVVGTVPLLSSLLVSLYSLLVVGTVPLDGVRSTGLRQI